MSDFTTFPGSFEPVASEPVALDPDHRRPKHRRDDVPVDGGIDLSEFGENPDSEVAG